MTVSFEQYTRKNTSPHTSIYLEGQMVDNFWRRAAVFDSGIVVHETDVTPRLSPDALKAISKVKTFLHLTSNWDSYNAAPPSPNAVEQAISFIKQLDRFGIPVYFTAPGPNGEIVVELKNEEKSAEIYFYPDEPADYVLFIGEECEEEHKLEGSLKTIIQFIKT
ncbi:MAG: hypothetical protein H6560_08890 [Lewinellaceae bacterium]|nr:hypothetical protein [Lewinellaceae bacterium]